jgi:hypothetical protein
MVLLVALTVLAILVAAAMSLYALVVVVDVIRGWLRRR